MILSNLRDPRITFEISKLFPVMLEQIAGRGVFGIGSSVLTEGEFFVAEVGVELLYFLYLLVHGVLLVHQRVYRLILSVTSTLPQHITKRLFLQSHIRAPTTLNFPEFLEIFIRLSGQTLACSSQLGHRLGSYLKLLTFKARIRVDVDWIY
jgi:hypothetical protein